MKCPTCLGQKILITSTFQDAPDPFNLFPKCDTCNGTGTVPDEEKIEEESSADSEYQRPRLGLFDDFISPIFPS